MNDLRPIRVLLADDHILFRKAVVSLLGTEPGYAVVGEATNGQEALDLALALRPDLILMDLAMPVMDGLEATRRIKAALPDARIVMLTMAEGDENLDRAIQSGAGGYLLKEISSETFFRNLRAVMQGEAAVSGAMVARVLAENARAARRASVPPSAVSPLTIRERDVAALVALGKSNKEIAMALFIAEATVKNHLANIMEKLHLENRVQAAAYALQNNV